MKRLRRWGIVSLVLGAVSLFVWANSHDSDGHYWVHYATSDRWPVIVDGWIEFGFLGKPQAWAPTSGRAGYSWSGVYEFSPYLKAHPRHDTDDNFARTILFSFGDFRITQGRIIPPWGWKDNVVYGDKASIAIPYTEIDVSMLWPTLGCAIVPLLWWRRARIEGRRVAAGRCPVCGYDVRATPDAGGPLLERCPECGTELSRVSDCG